MIHYSDIITSFICLLQNAFGQRLLASFRACGNLGVMRRGNKKAHKKDYTSVYQVHSL